LKLALLFIILIIPSFVSANLLSSKKYEGCGVTKKEALYTLSGNIQSRISTTDTQRVEVTNNESVQSKISSYSNASTKLSLVNIQYKNKGKEVCAVVYKDDQKQNTQKLLNQALLYDAKNLPKDVDSKIEMLTLWIDNIKQLSYLIPVFLEHKDKEQATLNAKEKTFKDIYDRSIAYSESLFFKSCKSTQEDAKSALSKKLFSPSKQKEEKGFFSSITSSITSLVSSDDSNEILDMFDEQLITLKKDTKECVMLKKADLLNIAQSMYEDMSRVSEKSLSKDPKKRYKEIDNLYKQLQITRVLLKLYPERYKTSSFNQLNEVQKRLTSIRETTYPQFIVFNLSGAENILITLDNKPIKNNERRYIKDGEHTYKIRAEGKCSLIDSFSSDLFEDHTISKDLSSYSYPTVTFITDKEPNISVNGSILKANTKETLKECKGTVRYLAKFAGQTMSGEIDSSPGEKNVVELNFLTAQELKVFNDAKTKNYSTTSESMFSESLTPVNSEQLHFSVTREPTHGKVTLDESGSFQYVSDKDYVGVDNFGYEIQTPQKRSAPKLVSIKVGPSIVAKAVAVVQPKSVDVNQTDITKPKEEQTLQENAKKKLKEAKEKVTVSYEDFKMYVESKQASGELSEEFLKKLQKKFPVKFERLRKEMTH